MLRTFCISTKETWLVKQLYLQSETYMNKNILRESQWNNFSSLSHTWIIRLLNDRICMYVCCRYSVCLIFIQVSLSVKRKILILPRKMHFLFIILLHTYLTSANGKPLCEYFHTTCTIHMLITIVTLNIWCVFE